MIPVTFFIMPGSRVQTRTSRLPWDVSVPAVPRKGETVTIENGWEYKVVNVDYDLRGPSIWVCLGDQCV